jgi:hypothetical protein
MIVHWMVDDAPKCGEAGSGVAVPTALDPNQLLVTCDLCVAFLAAELRRE